MFTRFIFLVSLFLGLIQNAVCQDIYSPFTKVNSRNQNEADKFTERSIHYTLSLESIQKGITNTRETLLLEIPTLTKNKVVALERVQMLAGTYELQTQDGVQISNASTYKFYQGKVEGADKSNVGMSIINDEIHLLIHDEEGTFEVSKAKGIENEYVGFYTDEIKEQNFIPCETDTEDFNGISGAKSNVENRAGPLDCVEIYLEIDFKAYQKQGSSLSDTEGWALAILAQVAIFYADAGVPITVSGIKVYTNNADDPYTAASNTAEALTAFKNNLDTLGFNGRLAHLMSGRGLGGGRAYLNVLCSNGYNYGVSGNLTSGGTTYSSYTWNINVIAHELGHNFGSSHTHDCAWNGNNTQIDDCGNVWLKNNGYNPGFCYDSTSIILPGNTATIMSYCHAVGGASINLNLGFHPQVRDVIYSNYASTNCGGSEACIGVPPSNDLCADTVRLIPTLSCNPSTFDNLYASSSGASPNFSCGGSGVKDVWFVVSVPESGLITLETTQISGGLSDMMMQVYSGNCGNLIAESCDDNAGSVNHSKIDIDNISLANEDLIIRVVEKNDVEGEFGICAYSTSLPCSDLVDDLNDFYTATGGAEWTNNDGWADGQAGLDCNFCNWYGVSCDAQGQITAIQLSRNNLVGSLDNSLLNLDQIETLDLHSNGLTGTLDASFVNPLNLKHLYLSGNAFSGSIPDFLVDAPKLESLTASENNLSGNLPGFAYSSKVTFLDLGENNFSGCYPSTYTRFFSSAEINVNGNPDLPFNGDFYLYSTDYSGFDFDKDSYCFNIDDCNDFNNTVYDGAPELCDGLDNDCDDAIDEGLDSGPNTWVGPISEGKWNVNANWSMGHVPLTCEDVEIGMTGSTIELNSSGSQNYFEQELKSLCVGPNTTLDLPNNFALYVRNGFVLNLGTLNLNGYTSFLNLDPLKNGVENLGTFTINSGTFVSIGMSGVNGFHNKPGGVLNNFGTLRIDSNNPVTGNVGLLNEHIINNTGYIDVRGDFKVLEVQLKPSSQLNNTGEISIGGESYGGEN